MFKLNLEYTYKVIEIKTEENLKLILYIYYIIYISYSTSGSCAVYTFLYSILYYYTKLSFDSFSSTILYFGYSLIFCAFFFITAGMTFIIIIIIVKNK